MGLSPWGDIGWIPLNLGIIILILKILKLFSSKKGDVQIESLGSFKGYGWLILIAIGIAILVIFN